MPHPSDVVIVRDSVIPLHRQILNQMRYLILSGLWPPGARVPSEAAFQRHLNVSRNTIRQALANAEREGLIERVPGKGTFVTCNPGQALNHHLIGYITFDFLSDFQRQLLNGVEQAAKERGYRIIFCNSNHDVYEEDRLLDQLVRDRVGGIIIWPALDERPNRRLMQLVQQRTIPIVLIDRVLPNVECDCVMSDNYGGMYTATKYLIDLGHRRIVFLSRPILQLKPVGERLRGYRQAMADAGLTPLEPWLVGTANKEISTEEVLQRYASASSQDIENIVRLLRRSPRPTAIVAMNDLMAVQALRAAHLLDLRVPADLSIVGFDDMEIARHAEVPLTTVSQNTFMLGQRAAQMLIERIEGDTSGPRLEVLPTRLVVRASTGPAVADEG